MKYWTDRHKALAQKLIEASNKRGEGKTAHNDKIASMLNISVTTVINYTEGRIKDAYLGEDILKLLKTK